jgi:branched-chain amino acid transport system permease protein
VDTFITYTALGLVIAAGYAVISSGLVLTYATTGVFNFAQGATGMLAAFVYWQLHVSWGWNTIVSLVVTLGVLAPLAGIVIELLFRGLQDTSENTKLVVSVSLLFSMIGLANLLWKPNQSHVVQRFFGNNTVHWGPIKLTWHDLATVVVAIVVAVLLRWLLYRSRIGVAMRATVDDPALGSLNGIRTVRVSQLSWVLGTVLAAVGGVLVAPGAGLDAVLLSTLIVNAYAAAIFGRLRSLSMTFVGAIVLGLADSYLQGYLPQSQYLAGLRLASPVIILFIALLVLPSPRLATLVRTREYFPAPSRRGLVTFAAIVLAGGLMLAATLSLSDLNTYGYLFSFGIIGLSLVPLFGFANQVSLCQLSLAGVGAITMAHFGHQGNPLGLVLAVVVSALVGALVALPALRLSGIYLALATAAFAVALDRWVFTLPNFDLGPWTIKIFEGGSTNVDNLRLGGVRFDSPKAQFVLLVVAFTLCCLFVGSLRRSRFGRRLIALRDSEAACATFGMSLIGTRVAVFAISAGIAGLGGALYGMQRSAVNPDDFQFTAGLPLFMVVAIGGAGFVSAGLFTGASLYGLFPLTSVLASWYTRFQNLTVGFAGIGLGREPSGAAPQFRQGFEPLTNRPPLMWGTLGGLAVWSVLRLVHASGNWTYVIGLIVIVVAGAAVAVLLDRREALAGRPREAPTPLEWVGLSEPWTPERLAEVERELVLEEFSPAVAAARVR